MLARLTGLLTDPRLVARAAWRHWPRATYEQRVRWDAVDRVQYAYCVLEAARQARALGIERISAIEFGVAGGNGLVELETISDHVHREVGVSVEVYGFDTGSGMPPASDYRDLPYVWQEGFFAMDEAALRSRLRHAELVVGDVSETVSEFVARPGTAPIGFIAFDLDYYSSTVSALTVLSAPSARRLPRLFCYFDDVIGDDWEIHCPYVGELLAIEEFNAAHETTKLAPIHGLRHKRKIPAMWNDQVYVCHDFGHPLYNHHVHPANWDLSLNVG